MTNERHDSLSELWQHARRERMQIAAEAMTECARTLIGGSGSESAEVDEGGGVVWPSDFDHHEYMRWAEEVDEIYAAEQLERERALEDERRNDA